MYTIWRHRELILSTTNETAGHDATRQIRQRIVSGELPPGVQLGQSQLAEELGVSRIPVRDALQQLAAEGLVTLRPNASATVAPLSITDLQELYELRDLLEPRLCGLAVPLLTSEDFAEMERELLRMEAAGNPVEWLDANNAFHAAIYERAPRPRMVELVDRIRQHTDRYSRIAHEFNEESARSEHLLILEAARNAEPARLVALVRAHIASGYETMLTILSDELLDVTPARAGLR